jgi:regulator of protease activity HflC (stomatin/prohibitin superfamily)
MALPLIDQIVAVVDLREMVLRIQPQHAITKDNINIWLSGVVCVKVIDPKAFTYNIQRPLYALLKLAESSMRAECGKLNLDSLLHERVLLNDGVKHSLAHTREAWGVEVLRYEVTDINPDERVMEAMDLQAVAERERRREVIKAEADRQATMTRAEGDAYAVEREARAKAEAIKMAADAQAYAVAAVATAMAGPLGRESVQIDLAKDYIQTLSKLGENSRLLMIPGDPSDVNAVVSRATAIASQLLQSPDPKPASKN